MKFKGNVNYVVETRFLESGNSANELLEELIYTDFKKVSNNEV